MTSAIRLGNLTFGYDWHPTVHHLEREFKVGSLTAIVGPNGTGKSTLLKGLMGMIQPLEGYVQVNECNVSEIGFLPQ